jgi:pyruvate dehydrogenase E2 component (dihydrolipoamide acetyltransferase)
MPIEITIPRLGWSMEEGIFSGWLKENGDPVKSGEPLYVLESEKSAQDIESAGGGVLHIPADSPRTGDTVLVGQVIGSLLQENDSVESISTTAEQSTVQNRELQDDVPQVEAPISPTPMSTPAKNNAAETRPFPASSPRARRKAAELSIEVNELKGSGSSGRIVEADVLKAAANSSSVATAVRTLKPASPSIGHISSIRRNIAERTALSFSQIPHFYIRAEVDATELVRMREHLVNILDRECHVRITLTDFILCAQSRALSEFPKANAIWHNEGILSYADADVGVVVGLPEGLVIPVIRASQRLSFVQLAKERERLVQTVREGKFNAEMFSGGATSISNLGTTRIDEFSAIIAPHQSSMLAVGRAALRPYVVDGRLEVRTTIRLCLSVDHRVLDGGPAAEFLGRIVELLENPKALLDGI